METAIKENKTEPDFGILISEYLQVINGLQDVSIELYNSINKIATYDNAYIKEILDCQSEDFDSKMDYIDKFRFLLNYIIITKNCMERNNEILRQLF
jgi:hypothetical protein